MARDGAGRRNRYERERERYAQEEQLDSLLDRRQLLVRGGTGLALVAGLPAFLAACGGDDNGGGGQPGGSAESKDFTAKEIQDKYGTATLGDSWHSLQLAILADRARGGQLAAKAIGQRYRGISADLDPVKQISTVQNGFNSGIKGMNTIPMAASNVNPIDRAARSVDGMYTTTYNSPEWKTPVDYGPQYITYFAPDDRGMGRTMTENLVREIGGKGTIVHLQGLAGATADILRTKGIDDVLKENPDVKLEARTHTDWSAVDSRRKMQSLLSSIDTIDGVVASNDDIGIGAFNAIRGTGKEIPVVSIDGTKQVFDLITDSFYLGTVNTYTHWLGGYATVLMFDALNGWKPEPAETMMFWETRFFGKEQAAEYVKAFYGSQLPYDFTRMSKLLYPDDWDPQQQLRAIDPNYLWEGFKKPKGYELPDGYEPEAIEKTTAKYDEHWQNRNQFST